MIISTLRVDPRDPLFLLFVVVVAKIAEIAERGGLREWAGGRGTRL